MESTYFIDKKSLSLIKFFKTYNVIIAVLNAIAIIFICFMIATHKSEPVKSTKADDTTSYYSTYDGDDSQTEKTENQKNGEKAAIIFLTIFLGAGYTILIFMGTEMIIKHFSNVAENKGIQFEMFKQTEEYGYYVKHLEETKNN
ncbi:hypothetical protein ACWN83_09020 [Pseudolactococcus plantarum]|nr:hypothetical protein [Lactococcus plantarum]HCN73875.1 hypothetical protein [Lactococcus sp.]